MASSLWDAPDDPANISESEAWFRRRTVLSDDAYAKLSKDARRKAFRVAGLAKLDLIQDVFDSLADALRDGTPFEEWKAAIGQHVEDAWAGTVANPGWRLEIIFRTNLQSAYAAGRYEQATDPDVLPLRPYWRFDAVLDSRTSPICQAAHGTIRAADDAWWGGHHPPCHFGCRSAVITLSESQAARFGGVTPRPTKIGAQDGFGQLPGADEFEPRKRDYDHDLWQTFQTAQSKTK